MTHAFSGMELSLKQLKYTHDMRQQRFESDIDPISVVVKSELGLLPTFGCRPAASASETSTCPDIGYLRVGCYSYFLKIHQ